MRRGEESRRARGSPWRRCCAPPYSAPRCGTGSRSHCSAVPLADGAEARRRRRGRRAARDRSAGCARRRRRHDDPGDRRRGRAARAALAALSRLPGDRSRALYERARLDTALARRRRADRAARDAIALLHEARRQGPRRARLRRRPARRAPARQLAARRDPSPERSRALRRRRSRVALLRHVSDLHIGRVNPKNLRLRLRHRPQEVRPRRRSSPTPCATAASARS